MDFIELAKKRYSVRSFAQIPVEEENLKMVLEAGRLAPTAVNYQPQKIYVLRSEDAIKKVRKLTPYAFNAPIVLMICGDKNVSWKSNFTGHDSTEMDVSIVCTHMMLEAADLGLGTTWVLWVDPAELKKAFQLPKHIEPYCLLPLGYPAHDAFPNINHNMRKPISETVIEL